MSAQDARAVALFLLQDIAATAQPKQLVKLSSLGRCLMLSDDYALNVVDSGKWSTWQIVQGEPLSVEPESIPLEILLPHFRAACERRIYLANKRIARLVESIESYRQMRGCLNLGALAKAIQDFQNS